MEYWPMNQWQIYLLIFVPLTRILAVVCLASRPFRLFFPNNDGIDYFLPKMEFKKKF